LSFESLQDFVYEYFTAPLAHPDTVAPYNLVNTLAFAAIALVAAYLIFKGLGKAKIAINREFFISILPFVFFGSSVRVAVDAQVLPREVVVGGMVLYPFVTPMVYAFTFLVVVACLAAAVAFKNKFHQIMRVSGVAAFFAVTLCYTGLFKNYAFFALIVGLAVLGLIVSEAVSLLAAKFYGKAERRLPERVTVFGHAFDGAATLTGVMFLGYSEQHIVANALFGVGTPVLFFIVKVLFASLAVELFARELKEPGQEQQKVFLLLLVTIFGLAPGLRDALRILAGV